MSNEKVDKELLEEIKDIAEVIILNVREDMQDEMKKYTSSLEKEIIKQRKDIVALEELVEKSFDNLAREITLQKLIDLLEQIV